MPTWYLADQSRSASSASSEHQCRFAGASCTRARSRVLRPHFSQRSAKMRVVVLDRDGLRAQVGEQLARYRLREPRGEGLVGLVGESILVPERVRVGHAHADVVVGLEDAVRHLDDRAAGPMRQPCRCCTVVMPDSSISNAE